MRPAAAGAPKRGLSWRIKVRHQRRALEAVMRGRGELPWTNLRRPNGAQVEAVAGVTYGSRPWREPHARLVAALRNAGQVDELLDGLADLDAGVRRRAVQMCGYLQLPEAVYPIRTRLADRDRTVRMAAARALGRIGGRAASDGLLQAMLARRLPLGRLAIELGRAAPDLYLREVLTAPGTELVRTPLAAAAAIQRRRVNAIPLARQLQSVSPREREAARRALIAIGELGTLEPAEPPALGEEVSG